jgi:hypothetical protein
MADIFASRDAIALHALEAARCGVWGNGAIGNPWPAGTDAHAAWQAEFDRLVVELQQVAA